MFDGCYALQDPTTGRWLGAGATPTFLATTKAQAVPFFFKASDLGRYLLRAPDGRLPAGSGARTSTPPRPGATADWAVERPAAGSVHLQPRRRARR